ncbi:hypothetical protein D3C72_1797990 [compost metagenome]
MGRKGLEPAKLVVEFGARSGVPIREVEAAHKHSVDRRLDVAALREVGIARQTSAGLVDCRVTSQNGHAVPALLAQPDRVIACVSDCRCGEVRLLGLELLEADDVRSGSFEPLQ